MNNWERAVPNRGLSFPNVLSGSFPKQFFPKEVVPFPAEWEQLFRFHTGANKIRLKLKRN